MAESRIGPLARALRPQNLVARIDGASDQPAQQLPYAREQALEQAEDADQQAADEGSETAEHAHGANASVV
jgi:hypothetical protein